jgi:hypothetical protein
VTENVSDLPIPPQQKDRFTRKYDMKISATKTGVLGTCRKIFKEINRINLKIVCLLSDFIYLGNNTLAQRTILM